MGFRIEISPNAFSSMVLSIDEQHLTYHDMQMDLQDVVAFRYGATSRRVNGIEVGVTYDFAYLDSSEDEIKIRFGDGLFSINEAEFKFNEIIKATWYFLGNRMLNEALAKISRGEETIVGGYTCSREGVQIVKKPLFGKEKTHLIKWNHVRHDVTGGFLNFKSAVDSDIYSSSSVIHGWNKMILAELFQQARTSRQMLNYLEGKEVFNYSA